MKPKSKLENENIKDELSLSVTELLTNSPNDLEMSENDLDLHLWSWHKNSSNFFLQNLHCESEKHGPFSFQQNFGKYCPILIILSLLQTDINCDQVYPKIYHHTSNLLPCKMNNNVFANVAGMIS